MSNECGNVDYSTECSDEFFEFAAENTSPEMVASIVLGLPAGSQIISPDGEVLYTVEGGPNKAHIKIPPIN